MLASDHDNVRPDVVLLGKALSGGGKLYHVVLLPSINLLSQFTLSLPCSLTGM